MRENIKARTSRLVGNSILVHSNLSILFSFILFYDPHRMTQISVRQSHQNRYINWLLFRLWLVSVRTPKKNIFAVIRAICICVIGIETVVSIMIIQINKINMWTWPSLIRTLETLITKKRQIDEISFRFRFFLLKFSNSKSWYHSFNIRFVLFMNYDDDVVALIWLLLVMRCVLKGLFTPSQRDE